MECNQSPRVWISLSLLSLERKSSSRNPSAPKLVTPRCGVAAACNREPMNINQQTPTEQGESGDKGKQPGSACARANWLEASTHVWLISTMLSNTVQSLRIRIFGIFALFRFGFWTGVEFFISEFRLLMEIEKGQRWRCFIFFMRP